MPSRRVPAVATLIAAGLLAGAAPAVAAPTGPPREIASGLNVPWELAVAPDGRTFVTERPGTVRVLGADDSVSAPILSRTDPAFGGANVTKFLGLALDPAFASNRIAYLYVTVRTNDGPASQSITGFSSIYRVREDGGRLNVLERVFTGIDSDANHDGGRMRFGPDGKLYVTTGDVHRPERPRDKQSLNGKILRFDAPTSGPLGVPADNPFVAEGGNARHVWSYGHRHPQGLDFDATGALWESEHGPSGEAYGPQYPGGNGRSGRDELNLIRRGGDYGWPIASGAGEQPAGTIAPVAAAGDAAWAPGGLTVGRDGDLYAPLLAGQDVLRFTGAPTATQQSSAMRGFGRLRVSTMRGRDLLVAQDGGTARVYALPLGDPAPAAAPPAGGGTAAPAPASGAPAPGLSNADRARVRALRDRVRTATLRLGANRLQAGRTAVVRAGGLGPARVTVQIRRRTSKGPLLSTRTLDVRDRKTRTFRLRMGPIGRDRLRRRTSPRMVVRVIHRRDGGPTTVEQRSLQLSRAGG